MHNARKSRDIQGAKLCSMHRQIITKEIAKVIQPQFKETDLDTLTIIVKRYHDQETDQEDNLNYSSYSNLGKLRIFNDSNVCNCCTTLRLFTTKLSHSALAVSNFDTLRVINFASSNL